MTYKPHNLTITEEFRLNGCLSLELQEKIVDIIDGLKDTLNVSVNSIACVVSIQDEESPGYVSLSIVMEDLNKIIDDLGGV